VLVTSAWKENTNIITMRWHMVLEFSPSLVACCISNANHSFEMIRRSHECVINVPTIDLVNEVIGIGNCSGGEVDKFKAFELTPAPATHVSAPLIKECYANFECRLADDNLISKYDLGNSSLIQCDQYLKWVSAPGAGYDLQRFNIRFTDILSNQLIILDP
jgi:flavin reductase (DIM6/NTAB) family NADH-FMN oxidoreductase RutF